MDVQSIAEWAKDSSAIRGQPKNRIRPISIPESLSSYIERPSSASSRIARLFRESKIFEEIIDHYRLKRYLQQRNYLLPLLDAKLKLKNYSRNILTH